MLKVGDRVRGEEVGREGSRWFIWWLCPECDQRRWVEEREVAKLRFTGLCRNCRVHLKGTRHWNWKGGHKLSNGYILEKCLDHPRTNKQGYVRQHILVWERAHNRLLPSGWIVHHYNGLKDDNRPSNLVAMEGKAHDRLIPLLQERIAELEKELRQELPEC